MTSRHDTNRPNLRDKVWVYDRILAGLQPNGYVQWINWRSEDKEVHVKYLDCPDVDKIPMREFRGNYCDNDQWMLPKSAWEAHLANIKSGSWRP